MALMKVKTTAGWVEGIPAGNQAIGLFRGIPYAAPPVGELRWKKPQPVKPWDGVLKAYKFPNICWQNRVASEGGGIIANEFYCLDHPRSEDCLYLNVWTPANSADEKLPVCVYFHGGGYSTGYGFLNCYDGEGFAKRGVITVTINHRLNLYGFLAHPWLTEEGGGVSGNYGAWDLLASLEWVRDNIAAFGGDPECVTIFGQSGGGGKVQTMVASPLAKGLVKRAIMQSGGGMSSRAQNVTVADAEAMGVKFFDFMGFKSLEEARAADAEALLEGYNAFAKTMPDPRAAGMAFRPIIDGELIPESVNKIFLEGKQPDLDFMIGCTSQEMYNPDTPLPTVEKVEKDSLAYGERAADYVAATHIKDDDAKAKQVFTNVGGNGMTANVLAWCENQLALGRKPAHAYYLTIIPPGAETAHHSAEHHYVFQTLMRSTRPYTGRDWTLSNQLASYWANFMKTGDPNGDGLPKWEAYTEDCKKELEITYDLHMTEIPETDYIRFMKEFSLGK